MLSEDTIKIVKSTVPLLEEHGATITATMYNNMFRDFPEVRSFFNNSHVRGSIEQPSKQATTLANAVHAYAANIDNLGVLTAAVETMVEKHVSFHVLPDHYKVVGPCLLGAMKEVLGEDVVTQEVQDAWGEAYWFLANLLIDKEKVVREERRDAKGGWEGYAPFVITKKVKESDFITSIYLKNARNINAPMVSFKPGQYISLKIPQGEIPGFDYDLVRNYSLSCRPDEDFLRISVKREEGKTQSGVEDGVISTYLHEKTRTGTNILIGIPCGSFYLDEQSGYENIVLLSAGIGLTPLVSILEHNLSKENGKKSIKFIQSVRDAKNHALKYRMDDLASSHSCLTNYVFYSNEESHDHQLPNTMIFYKKIEKDDLAAILDEDMEKTVFYYCGPLGYQDQIKGILTELGAKSDQLHTESFNPSL